MASANFVIGIDNQKGKTVYRVLTANHNQKETDAKKAWAFKGSFLAEENLIAYLIKGGKFSNATLKDGKVVGSTGSFERFGKHEDGKPDTYILISEITNEDGVKLGYRVANYMCRVMPMTMENITKHCTICEKANIVPFQNAIFKGKDSRGYAIISAYPGADFYKEVFYSNSKQRAQNAQPAKPNMVENAKNMENKTSVFSKEQLVILKGLQNKGINPNVIANPKLSVSQMEVLADALTHKVNVKPFASPEFSPEAMAFISLNIMRKNDVTPLLNPAYSKDQMVEISLGILSGLDVSAFADIKMSAKDMAQIRTRMEADIWSSKTVKMTKDASEFIVSETVKTKKKKVAKGSK